MLQFFGNLFVVRLAIYYEFGKVKPGHYSGTQKMLEFECRLWAHEFQSKLLLMKKLAYQSRKTVAVFMCLYLKK